MEYYFPADVAEPGLVRTYETCQTLEAAETLRINRIDQTDDLISRLRVRKNLRVYGKPKMGKTIILPKLIATELRKTVIVVQPDTDAAFAAYQLYASRPNLGLTLPRLNSACITQDDQDIADGSIVWIGAHTFVSWLYARKKMSMFDCLLKSCVVVLDQAEQRTKYHIALESIVPSAGPYRYISITSTLDAMKKANGLKTFVTSVRCCADQFIPSDWDIWSPGEPWDCFEDMRSMVMFVNSDVVRRALHRQCVSRGVSVVLLDETSDHNDFVEATYSLEHFGELAVVIADSSFRVPFRFSPQRIVDAGDVDGSEMSETPIDYALTSDTESEFKDLSVAFEGFPSNIDFWDSIDGIHEEARFLPESGNYLKKVLSASVESIIDKPSLYERFLWCRERETVVEYIDKDINSDTKTVNKYSDKVLEVLLKNCQFDLFRPTQQESRLTLDNVIDICVIRFNRLGAEIVAIRGIIFEILSRLASDGYAQIGVNCILRLPYLFRILDVRAVERRRLKVIFRNLTFQDFKLINHSVFNLVDFRRCLLRKWIFSPINVYGQMIKGKIFDKRIFSILLRMFAFNRGFSPGYNGLNHISARSRVVGFWKMFHKAVG